MEMYTTTNTSTGFGFWASLPLSRKLLVTFSALALLALVVGVVANTGLRRVQTSYDNALAGGEAMELISLHVSADLLTARRHEKDFLARWTDQGFDTAYANYVVPNQEAVAEVREHLDELAAFGPLVEQDRSTAARAQYEADLAILTESIDLYEQNFLNTVQLLQEKGFQDTGLEGQFRDDVHNIEDRIYDRPGLEPLVITLLQTRRREKDYLLRGDQEYIDGVHQYISDLKGQIAASDLLEPTEKREMTALADQYLVSFDALTVKDVEVAASIQAFRDAAHTIEPLVENLTVLGAELSQLDVARAQTNSTQTLLYSSIILVIALLVALFLSVALARQITRPVVLLTNTAQEISTGKFDIQAQVTSGDEIGTLAQSFNIMTAELGRAFADVRRRAVELATVAEVSTATSTILESKALLQEVVDLTRDRFSLYHSHIYLLDEQGENLVLAAGAGEPGRQMVAQGRSISLNREQSLVARAARERKGVTVNDVTQAPDFLPNPLLPNTRSELAVPMIVGGNVIGVFDVQSDVVGRFTDSDINIQTTLAAQVATSVQNVRSFEHSKTQADFESLVNTIGQKIQRAATMEDTLQTAIRELGNAIGATRVRANVALGRENGGNKSDS